MEGGKIGTKGQMGHYRKKRRVQALFEKPPSPVGFQLAQGGGEETKLKLEQRCPNGRETQTKALKKLRSNSFFFFSGHILNGQSNSF